MIEPFFEKHLGPCSYDLTIGNEYISLRDPRTVNKLNNDEILKVGPRETVLILTAEYIALPRNIIGFVVPKARWLFEGTSINATRIEPSWYGKLLISFTNNSNSEIRLQKEREFCTCMFAKLDKDVEKILTEERVYFLGRESIGHIRFDHLVPIPERAIHTILLNDMDKVVRDYGPPWDVVRGAIHRIKDKAQEYLAGDLGPELVKQASSVAMNKAYNQQNKIMIAFISVFGVILAAILLLLYNIVFNK